MWTYLFQVNPREWMLVIEIFDDRRNLRRISGQTAFGIFFSFLERFARSDNCPPVDQYDARPVLVEQFRAMIVNPDEIVVHIGRDFALVAGFDTRRFHR